jgi:hypothetical protein
VLDLQRQAVEAASQGTPPPALRRLIQRLNTLAADFTGSGSRPGTLYPPTAAQRRALGELRQAIGAARGDRR